MYQKLEQYVYKIHAVMHVSTYANFRVSLGQDQNWQVAKMDQVKRLYF